VWIQVLALVAAPETLTALGSHARMHDPECQRNRSRILGRLQVLYLPWPRVLLASSSLAGLRKPPLQDLRRWSPQRKVRQNACAKCHCKTKPGVKATYRHERASESSSLCHQRGWREPGALPRKRLCESTRRHKGARTRANCGVGCEALRPSTGRRKLGVSSRTEHGRRRLAAL